MADFVIFYIDINAAERIDCIRQPCKTYRDKIRNIQIQIQIQHADCHFRPALCIGRVTFIIGIIAQIQISITEYGNKFAFSGILINGGNHNRIASGVLCQRACRRIHAEQRDVPISLHCRFFFFFYCVINNDFFFIQLHLPGLCTLLYHPENAYQNYQCKNFYDEKDNSPAFLFCLFLLFLCRRFFLFMRSLILISSAR